MDKAGGGVAVRWGREMVVAHNVAVAITCARCCCIAIDRSDEETLEALELRSLFACFYTIGFGDTAITLVVYVFREVG